MIEESAAHALRAPVAVPAAQAVAAPAEQLELEAPAEESRIKNVALFLAAPFIGLAYAVMLPLVGFAMLAWTAWKAMNVNPAARKVLAHVKSVALFVAAPFIGLIYAVSLPFVGTAMLVMVAGKALLANKQTA